MFALAQVGRVRARKPIAMIEWDAMAIAQLVSGVLLIVLTGALALIVISGIMRLADSVENIARILEKMAQRDERRIK